MTHAQQFVCIYIRKMRGGPKSLLSGSLVSWNLLVWCCILFYIWHPKMYATTINKSNQPSDDTPSYIYRYANKHAPMAKKVRGRTVVLGINRRARGDAHVAMSFAPQHLHIWICSFTSIAILLRERVFVNIGFCSQVRCLLAAHALIYRGSKRDSAGQECARARPYNKVRGESFCVGRLARGAIVYMCSITTRILFFHYIHTGLVLVDVVVVV